MNTTGVLALLPLFVVLAHSFSWDIVVGREKRLVFYHNGTATHTENIPSAKYITAVTYDSVHFRVLFVEYQDYQLSISSFDLTTRKIQTLVMKRVKSSYEYLAYDPVTQFLFWTEDYEIHSVAIKPASFNKPVEGNLLITLDEYCGAIAVDSCGGYIYWVSVHNVGRAAFDGSKREVLIDTPVFWRRSLAIDQQTEKMYWIEETKSNQHSIQSADLNGKNRTTIYFVGADLFVDALTVSKDFIFWRSYNQKAILQLPKHDQQGVAPVVYSITSRDCWLCQLTAANYTIEQQTLGNKSCEAPKSPKLDVEERHNNDEQRKCHNYCFQGNCSVGAEGHPKCRCNTGYSGDRCEVNPCRGYCLNNGDCSLHEGDEPVCRCSADYGGDRCELPAVLIKCIQTVSMLREMLSADVTPVTLSKGVSPTCA